MPNSASSKKRLRQSLDRRAQNRVVRSTLRSQLRKVREAIAAGDAEKCAAEFRVAAKRIDQTAAKGVIHANTAARLKSRLSHAIKGVRTKAQAAK